MISILNFIFTGVSYPMRWTKLDHPCIYFEEFLNQLNLLYKYRMSIMHAWWPEKTLKNWKSSVVIFSKYGWHMLTRLIKIIYMIYKL
jgi:hypothetical protein